MFIDIILEFLNISYIETGLNSFPGLTLIIFSYLNKKNN